MSAQPDLFAEPAPAAGELVVDLRERSAWHSIKELHNPDRYQPGVVVSGCGGYTITWTPEQHLDGRPQRYVAHKCNFAINPRNGQLERTHPTLIGGFDTPDAARQACAEHAEEVLR